MVATVDNVAAIIEVNSETDSVSKNEMLQDLVKNTAIKVAKSEPATMEEAMAIETEEGTIESDLIEATIVIGEKISLRRSEVVEKADDAIFGAYLHMGDRIAVLTVIGGTTSEEVAKDIAMHITAVDPRYVSESQVPRKGLEHEKAVLTEQALSEDKPTNAVKRMAAGRPRKSKTEIVLVDQLFVKDPDMTAEKLVVSKDGEVKSFARFEVDEGIEKREDSLMDEVTSRMKN